MRRAHFLAGSAALAAASGARASALAPFAQQFTIGVSVPLSGALEPYGRQILNGAQAAIDYTNRYQAPSQPVFYARPYDDQGTTAMALTNASFISQDLSVLAAIGPLTTDMILQAMPTYQNAATAVIIPANSADVITNRGFRGLYRLQTKDSTEGQLFARTALSQFKPVSSLAVTQDGTYGPDLAQGFTAQAKADKRTADTFTFSHDSPGFAAAANAIVATKADYVFLAGKVGSMGPLIPALIAAGYTGKFGLGDGFYDLSTTKQYGAQLSGSWVASGFPPLNRAPSVGIQLAEFQRNVGAVSAFSAYGYTAAQILISAIQRSNATTKVQVLQSMLTGSTYQTLTGSYTFNFAGDNFDPNIYFFSVQKDGFQYEKPAHPSGFII